MRSGFRRAAVPLLFVSFLLILPATLRSGVSLRNGNFFIGYTDIVLPGDFEMKIDRTYNSQSDHRGLFGFGWASTLETRLLVAPDGRVRVYEHGGGDQTEFVPDSWDFEDVEEAVALILDLRSGRRSPQQRLAYQDSLLNHSSFRDSEWESAVTSGEADPVSVSVGTRLFSTKRGGQQTIIRTPEGYRREGVDGTTYGFDEVGRLTSITHGSATDPLSPPFTNEVSYNAQGRLGRLTDPLGRSIRFFVGEDGHLDSLENATNGRKARYEYDERGALIRSVDVDDHEYRYTYDQVLNMVQIAYDDGTTLDVSYQIGDNRVTSVKERSGAVLRYTYEKEEDGSGSATTVWTVEGGEERASHRYEYSYGLTATGETWTHRIVEFRGGFRTETTYNECCGLPVTIQRSSGDLATDGRGIYGPPDTLATFEYNARGMLVLKESPREQVRLQYDEVVWKPSRVETTRDAVTDWVEYEYSTNGELTRATDLSGREIELHYSAGKIDRMTQGTDFIDFEYNDLGKPIRIAHSELGEIRVTYDEMGNIVETTSEEGGAETALVVTAMFQDLLSLIEPAGINLTP